MDGHVRSRFRRSAVHASESVRAPRTFWAWGGRSQRLGEVSLGHQLRLVDPAHDNIEQLGMRGGVPVPPAAFARARPGNGLRAPRVSRSRARHTRQGAARSRDARGPQGRVHTRAVTGRSPSPQLCLSHAATADRPHGRLQRRRSVLRAGRGHVDVRLEANYGASGA